MPSVADPEAPRVAGPRGRGTTATTVVLDRRGDRPVRGQRLAAPHRPRQANARSATGCGLGSRYAAPPGHRGKVTAWSLMVADRASSCVTPSPTRPPAGWRQGRVRDREPCVLLGAPVGHRYEGLHGRLASDLRRRRGCRSCPRHAEARERSARQDSHEQRRWRALELPGCRPLQAARRWCRPPGDASTRTRSSGGPPARACVDSCWPAAGPTPRPTSRLFANEVAP